MVRAIAIVMGLSCVGNVQGQNLVPNPSFEDTVNCPLGLDEVFNAKYWQRPTQGSSDYFNSCSGGLATVPVNLFGGQNPRTGNAYVGLGFDFKPINFNYREYIQVKLTSPLKAFNVYELSFFVSCADSATLAISGLGAYLSETSVGGAFQTVLNEQPQIVSLEGQYLSDKQNWVEVKGRFFASGGESYLTIGSFVDNASIDTVKIGDSPFFDATVYYYIDDVSLTEIQQVNLPNIFTPNGDGINDEFDLKISCPDCGLNLQVYNRWGTLLYNDSALKWDGNYNGNPCPEGVYFYVLKSLKEEKSTYSGFIQLQKL